MSSAMELNQDTLQQIGEYVKQHLPEWQRESGASAGWVRRIPRVRRMLSRRHRQVHRIRRICPRNTCTGR